MASGNGIILYRKKKWIFHSFSTTNSRFFLYVMLCDVTQKTCLHGSPTCSLEERVQLHISYSLMLCGSEMWFFISHCLFSLKPIFIISMVLILSSHKSGAPVRFLVTSQHLKCYDQIRTSVSRKIFKVAHWGHTTVITTFITKRDKTFTDN